MFFSLDHRRHATLYDRSVHLFGFVFMFSYSASGHSFGQVFLLRELYCISGFGFSNSTNSV